MLAVVLLLFLAGGVCDICLSVDKIKDFGIGLGYVHLVSLIFFYIIAAFCISTNILLIGCVCIYFVKSTSNDRDNQELFERYREMKSVLSFGLFLTFSYHTITGEVQYVCVWISYQNELWKSTLKHGRKLRHRLYNC